VHSRIAKRVDLLPAAGRSDGEDDVTAVSIGPCCGELGSDDLRRPRSGWAMMSPALAPDETAAKCWLRVEWIDGALRTWTYSYNCELDPDTGQVIRATFTK
jgi:hypothetical protein